MNINVEHQPNCRVIVHLQASQEEVQKERKGLVKAYGRMAKLPGYRPGKVPASVVEKRYGAEIQNELQQRLVSDGLQEAIRTENLDVLNILGLDNASFDEGAFSGDIEISLKPTFELPEYKKIPVKVPRVEVTEADVERDLEQLRERYQTYDEVEREAGLGDVVVASYEGTIDGSPVGEVIEDAPDHLKSLESQWFRLAENEDFLPGFYAGLVGVKKDDERELNLELPEDFAIESFQGKTLTLAVKVGEIREQNMPELDEEFVKKVGGDEMTLETLRDEVKQAIQRRKEQASEQSKANQVLEHLAEKLDFELPQEVVNNAAQRRTDEVTQRALSQGVGQEELIQNQESILNNATQQAQQDVKISFILGEVAKQENLQVSDGQLQMALATMAQQSGKPVKKFLKDAQKDRTIDRLREDLLLQNAIEFLKSEAEVEETDPEPEGGEESCCSNDDCNEGACKDEEAKA